MQVRYSPKALSDLRAIAAYIAKDDPTRARAFVAELRGKADRIASFPEAYQARDELGTGLRSAVHENYLLFYRVLSGEVRIERVLHGARDLPALF